MNLLSASFYLTSILIWGSSWFAIRFQLGVVDESVSLVYRFGLASLLLIAWCLIRRLRLRFTWREHMAMAAQGTFLFSTNYLLFYWCTGYITSGLVAILFSTVVIMNIFNGAIFLKRPIQPVVLLGAVCGLAGLALVFWPEIEAAGNGSEGDSVAVWHGVALGLVATFSASLGNILSARNQSVHLPVVQTNAWGMGYGALLMALYAQLSGATWNFDAQAPYVISLLYLSIFGSILAFGAYLSLVGRIGADKAAYATVLFPLVALAISSAYEGFEWTPIALVGVLLVLAGNLSIVGRSWLSRRAFSRRASP